MGSPVNDGNTDNQDDARGNNPITVTMCPPRQPDPLTYVAPLVEAFSRAMRAEGVPGDVARRIVSRVLYGNPCGPRCVVARDQAVQPGVEVHVHMQPQNLDPATAIRTARQAAAGYARGLIR